jgi:hypothetical protein
MHRTQLIVLTAGIVAVALFAAGFVWLNGGGSSTNVSKTVPDSGTPGASTGGTVGGPEILAKAPASRFAPAKTDLPVGYTVDVPDTFTQNISTFASSYLFDSSDQGNQLANQWQVVDGYQVYYNPDGLEAGLLQGRYYISAEIYLFNSVAGATSAYTYMDGRLTAGSEVVQTARLANASDAVKRVSGTVGTSNVVKAYYRYIFRRGNVVAIVQVAGSDPQLTVDRARDVAVIIDDRILGKRDNTIPTPIPTPAIHIAPTPTGTP